MREVASILHAWRNAGPACEQMLLATVVDVKGSAYRRPGARMLVTRDGGRVGSVSGGCLEADVVKRGWWQTESTGATVLIYDTTAEADAVWELGLGCNGQVRILLERVSRPETAAMLGLMERWEAARTPAVMATVIAAPENNEDALGARLFVTAADIDGSLLRTSLGPAIESAALQVLASARSRVVAFSQPGGTVEVFFEIITPALPVVIFGAGFDAVPLVQAAHQQGWHITVTDARPSYAVRNRFPFADQVLLTDPRNLLKGVSLGPESAAVVMNHSYAVDRELLGLLAPMNLQYLGLLGPRARAEQMMAELGIASPPTCLHAPIGLDLGADTPEGIGLSIVAEIQACVAGRAGGKLRERNLPIYAGDAPVHRAAVVTRAVA